MWLHFLQLFVSIGLAGHLLSHSTFITYEGIGNFELGHNLSRFLLVCRMLAEYLGEDQMLAVVCRSYEAASKLEKYEWDGKVDSEHALYAVAKTFGKPINDRFLVICLENIRYQRFFLIPN